MKVHCCVINSNDDGTLLSWHSSKRAAEKYGREQVRDHGDEAGLTFMSVDTHDIPTDKPGLLRWLNAYFTTDNG